MAILRSMATVTVKATYSLDEETVRELEGLAARLGVSKSEALRMAVRHLARAEVAPGQLEIAALDELEARLGLTEERAEEWAGRVRRERLASERV
jgi:hypothetical protein